MDFNLCISLGDDLHHDRFSGAELREGLQFASQWFADCVATISRMGCEYNQKNYRGEAFILASFWHIYIYLQSHFFQGPPNDQKPGVFIDLRVIMKPCTAPPGDPRAAGWASAPQR